MLTVSLKLTNVINRAIGATKKKKWACSIITRDRHDILNLRGDQWKLIDSFKLLAPVVQTLDSAILWINHYPLDNSIGFASVYPLDSNLSGGQSYPSFEQLGPDLLLWLWRSHAPIKSKLQHPPHPSLANLEHLTIFCPQGVGIWLVKPSWG